MTKDSLNGVRKIFPYLAFFLVTRVQILFKLFKIQSFFFFFVLFYQGGVI
jgi:hypothetical protein